MMSSTSLTSFLASPSPRLDLLDLGDEAGVELLDKGPEARRSVDRREDELTTLLGCFNRELLGKHGNVAVQVVDGHAVIGAVRGDDDLVVEYHGAFLSDGSPVLPVARLHHVPGVVVGLRRGAEDHWCAMPPDPVGSRQSQGCGGVDVEAFIISWLTRMPSKNTPNAPMPPWKNWPLVGTPAKRLSKGILPIGCVSK